MFLFTSAMLNEESFPNTRANSDPMHLTPSCTILKVRGTNKIAVSIDK